MRKNKKKSSFTSTQRRLLRIWIVVATIALFVVGSYAAYTNMNSVKRVVATGRGSGILFSSNYMTATASGTKAEQYTNRVVNISGDSPTLTVSVCNYSQEDITKSNENDITYRFVVTLVPKNGYEFTETDRAKYKVNGTGFAANSNEFVLLNQKLSGKEANKNTYKITLDSELTEYVNIRVEAIPNDTSYAYTGSNKLAGILSTSLGDNQQSTGWTGKFTDDQTKDAKDYAGFNYEISGNGKGTITLKWNSSKIEISPWFLEDTKTTATEQNNWKSIQFTVGTDETRNYTLQFYRVSTDQEEWSTIKQWVTCEFTENQDMDESGSTGK
jgi:hypothetical protein